MAALANAPTEAEILARARAMVPMLRERAGATETLRRLPDATDRAFRAAGFYKIMQPRRYGGLELDLPTFYRVVASIARGCASTGWMVTASGVARGTFPISTPRWRGARPFTTA